MPKSAVSETVRGSLTAQVEIETESNYSNSANFILEDLVSIKIPDLRFLQGIELEILIPEEIKKYRNSFALYLYNKITPEPSEIIRSYTGLRVLDAILPSSNRLFLYIPVITNHSLTPSPGSLLLDTPIMLDDFPLILTVIPIMKGIPNSTAKSRFQISASPVFSNSGVLLLDITLPEGEIEPEFDVYIDNKQVLYPSIEYILNTGIHQLRIESDNYETRVQSFGIEKGDNTRLNINMEKTVPFIKFEVPENTVIYLDGEKLSASSNRDIETVNGEHTVLFKIGDYSISKVFIIENGKKYKISLFLDILIQDD